MTRMRDRSLLASWVHSYGFWVVVIVAPMIFNGFVWAMLVRPQEARVSTWRQAHELAALKPKLEGLLTDSHRAFMDWERTGFVASDPAAVTQAVQRIAGRHRIQIKEVNTKAETGKAPAGFTTASLDVKATGHFSKLAHWMGELEAQSGLQIDSWTMAASSEPGKPHELTVNLTAFLREA